VIKDPLGAKIATADGHSAWRPDIGPRHGRIAGIGAKYARISLQDQVDAWVRLVNDGYSTATVSRLMEMGTFDGQRVDVGFLTSCIQLEPGICQQMVSLDRCPGCAVISWSSHAARLCQGGQRQDDQGSTNKLATRMHR
jgi:hypothetical protein